MNTETKLYKLFSPKQNSNIHAKLGGAILHPTPGMLGVDISRIFLDAELGMKNEIQGNISKDEVTGFRSPFCLLIACTYKAKGSMFDGITMSNLSMSGDDRVVEIGKRFLDTGAALLKRDPSGRSTISQGVNFLKVNFSSRDYLRGLDIAKTIYEESLM